MSRVTTYNVSSSHNQIINPPTDVNSKFVATCKRRSLYSVKKAVITQVSFPNNFFNVDTYNNKLAVRTFNSAHVPITQDVVIEVPVGHYTIEELLTVINDAGAASRAGFPALNVWPVDLVLDTDNPNLVNNLQDVVLVGTDHYAADPDYLGFTWLETESTLLKYLGLNVGEWKTNIRPTQVLDINVTSGDTILHFNTGTVDSFIPLVSLTTDQVTLQELVAGWVDPFHVDPSHASILPSFNPQTGKLSFQVHHRSLHSALNATSVTTTPTTNSIAVALGLHTPGNTAYTFSLNDEVEEVDNFPVSRFYHGLNTYNISGPSIAYLHNREFCAESITNRNQGTVDHMVLAIPINQPYQSTVHYEPRFLEHGMMHYPHKGERDLSTLKFDLLDGDGNLLRLRGGELRFIIRAYHASH